MAPCGGQVRTKRRTIETHVERVSSLAGPPAAVLQASSPHPIAAVRRTAADLAAAYVTDNGLEIPYGRSTASAMDAWRRRARGTARNRPRR